MRDTRVEMVEQKITTYKCDFCDFSTENNRGCCGTAPIMPCSICDKDACREHRDFFTEDPYEDYPYGFYACKDCEPLARKNWDWFTTYADRHADVVRLTIESVEKGEVYEDYY